MAMALALALAQEKDSITMNLDEKIDEILVNFFNKAEIDVHSKNNNNGSVFTKAGTEAKEAIKQLIEEVQTESYKKGYIDSGIESLVKE